MLLMYSGRVFHLGQWLGPLVDYKRSLVSCLSPPSPGGHRVVEAEDLADVADDRESLVDHRHQVGFLLLLLLCPGYLGPGAPPEPAGT